MKKTMIKTEAELCGQCGKLCCYPLGGGRVIIMWQQPSSKRTACAGVLQVLL